MACVRGLMFTGRISTLLSAGIIRKSVATGIFPASI